MNKVAPLFALLTLLFALQTPRVYAAFEDTGTGARPTVMGGTYVAAGGDVQSLMYNPAGLAQLHTHEISSEYSKLYSGLSDGSSLGQYFVGYGQPIKYGGTVAVGWKQFSLDDLYSERTLSIGYGEWITPKIAAGLSIKQLHHEFGAPTISVDDNGNISNQSPTFFSRYGNSKTVYSSDIGMLYRYSDRDTIGLAIQDVNEPNIALNPEDHEIVSRTLRAGISHRGDRKLTLAGGLTRKESLSNQDDYIWTGAIEKWWEMKDQGEVGARGSLATGSRSFQQMAMGASYRYSTYQVDYAFVFNLTGLSLGGTSGTHRFSFGYRFGPTSPERIRIQDKQDKSTKKPAAKKVRRAAVEDMPELEAQPKTVTPAPVAGQRIVRSKADAAPRKQRAVPAEQAVVPQPAQKPVPAEVLPETSTEETETAQLMREKPVVPVETPDEGPGLKVQVPAERTSSAPTAANEAVSAPPLDLEIPIQPVDQSQVAIEPLGRTQFLEATERMTSAYARRSQKRASADARLGALSALYPTLKGYALSQSGEMLDQVDQGDELDRSAKAYDRLTWNGASAQEKLGHLTRDLERTLVNALRDRDWDMADQRDRRYKAWLDQAIEKGRELALQRASAQSRLTYWGQVVKKALEYEQLPQEPVIETPVTVTPVQKPVKAQKPAVTPAEVTPAQVPASRPKASEMKELGRPLNDGEWLYRVQEGDTLLSLANRFFGDYNRWRDIYVINQDRLGRGGALRPGQLLVMPKKKAR